MVILLIFGIIHSLVKYLELQIPELTLMIYLKSIVKYEKKLHFSGK